MYKMQNTWHIYREILFQCLLIWLLFMSYFVVKKGFLIQYTWNFSSSIMITTICFRNLEEYNFFLISFAGDTSLLNNLPPVSTHSVTITTATPTTTSITSDVTVTSIVTTTTCCGVQLPSNSITTASVTVTTAHTTLTTTCSNSHPDRQPHHQEQAKPSYHHLHQPVQQQQPQSNTPYQTHSPIERKYTPHYNSQQKVVDSHIPKCLPSVIKRCPPTPPPLTRSSQPPSPARHKNFHSSSSSTINAVSTHPSVLSSSYSSNSVITRDIRRVTPPPSRSRTPRREDSRDRDPYPVLPPSVGASKSFLPQGLPGYVAYMSLVFTFCILKKKVHD